MEAVLRLIHPLAPFISEEIWQRMAPLAGVTGATIMRQPYPAPDTTATDQAAIDEINWVKGFIAGVRKIRSGMNIDPRKPVPVLLDSGSSTDKERLEDNRHYLVSVGRIADVTWLEAGDAAPESATALVGEMKLLIPLAGLIDKEAEIARLGKELDNKRNELSRCEKKLSNGSFTAKAPAAVVEKEQTRAAELTNAISSLEEQQEKIQAL
jgi:valyl-tRNA synthetase